MRSKDLWASAGRGDSKLPRFWKDALTALRERPLVARIPGSFTVDGARCQPLWSNPEFTIKSKFEEVWRERLSARSIKDLVTEDNTRWTVREVTEYIEEHLEMEENNLKVSEGKYVTVKSLLQDWSSIMKQVPQAPRKSNLSIR